MNIRTGSAPDSWGVWFPDDPRQIPWQRFMDEVSAVGYEWIELGPYGYLPTDIDRLRRELEARDLKVSGAFAMGNLENKEWWPEIERQVKGAGELLAATGAGHLILISGTYSDLFTGEIIDTSTLDDERWKHLIDSTHRVADLASDSFDLKLIFHPHAETHIEYEEQIERFLEETDPERISLCFDVGHHAYRGGDPVDFLSKHRDRIPYLHLKSVNAEKRKKVEDEKIPFAKAVAMDLFCEPSVGEVDFPALCRLLKQIDYDGYAIVEQDMYPAPFEKPLPIARRTLEYLRKIGFTDTTKS